MTGLRVPFENVSGLRPHVSSGALLLIKHHRIYDSIGQFYCRGIGEFWKCPPSVGSQLYSPLGPDVRESNPMRAYSDLGVRVERWSPSDLNFVIQELRREFPTCTGERLVRVVTEATWHLRSTRGRAQLLLLARVQLTRPG